MCVKVEEATQSVSQSIARVNKGSSGSSAGGSGGGPAAMATGMIMKFLGNGAAKLTDR